MAPLFQEEPQEAWSDTNLSACPVLMVLSGTCPSPLGSQALTMMELNFPVLNLCFFVSCPQLESLLSGLTPAKN